MGLNLSAVKPGFAVPIGVVRVDGEVEVDHQKRYDAARALRNALNQGERYVRGFRYPGTNIGLITQQQFTQHVLPFMAPNSTTGDDQVSVVKGQDGTLAIVGGLFAQKLRSLAKVEEYNKGEMLKREQAVESLRAEAQRIQTALDENESAHRNAKSSAEHAASSRQIMQDFLADVAATSGQKRVHIDVLDNQYTPPPKDFAVEITPYTLRNLSFFA